MRACVCVSVQETTAVIWLRRDRAENFLPKAGNGPLTLGLQRRLEQRKTNTLCVCGYFSVSKFADNTARQEGRSAVREQFRAVQGEPVRAREGREEGSI